MTIIRQEEAENPDKSYQTKFLNLFSSYGDEYLYDLLEYIEHGNKKLYKSIIKTKRNEYKEMSNYFFNENTNVAIDNLLDEIISHLQEGKEILGGLKQELNTNKEILNDNEIYVEQ